MFYYAGAATAAGQSYTGALLVSRDGGWPDDGEMPRVEKAFDTCGIKLWELFEVNTVRPCVMSAMRGWVGIFTRCTRWRKALQL